MVNMKELSKDKILSYAKFYDIIEGEIEKKLEKEILDKVDFVSSAGDLFELILKGKGILYWKGALRIKRYFEDENYWTTDRKEKFLKEIKSCNNDPINNKSIVNNIAKHSGIKFPIASTIVYFFSNGNCPVSDSRAVQTLQTYGYNEVKNSYDWGNYFDTCLKRLSKTARN